MIKPNINWVLRVGRKCSNRYIIAIINQFIRHWYSCDIYCQTKIADTVNIVHGGLGCTINLECIIEDDVLIQSKVTIGISKPGSKVPIIRRGVFIGAGAAILGGIEVGENSKIGANCVVTKNVPANCTVIGNPAIIIKENGLKTHRML
jgi:serine O-acetyltransferase